MRVFGGPTGWGAITGRDGGRVSVPPPPFLPLPDRPPPRLQWGGGRACGSLLGHRRGIRPRTFPRSSSSRRPAGPLLPASALPPSSSPPRAASSSSSSSSSLSLSICLSRPGIHSGLGAGAARPPSARPPGRPAVRPPVRLSAGAPACRPAQVSASRPSAGPQSRPAWGSPRPGPPWRRIAGPRGAPVHPSNLHPRVRAAILERRAGARGPARRGLLL